MADRQWDLMKFNLMDMSKDNFIDTDSTCAYVEMMFLPKNAIVTKRTRYEAKSKPNSEGSTNFGIIQPEGC